MTLLLVEDEASLHRMLVGVGKIEVIERGLHWRRVVADQINAILSVEGLIQIQNA